MAVRRKSHNLDEELLRRAARALGAPTETDAIHAALRAVLFGEEVVRALEASRRKAAFRASFARAMRAEGKAR